MELEGLLFPVNVGVAGSTTFYDSGCFVCPTLSCTCPAPVTKRELARREADVSRREKVVERREIELGHLRFAE
jgi:hypothetical protein